MTSLAFPKPSPRPKKPRRPLRRSWMKRRSARRIGRESEAEKLHKRMVREMRVCAVAKYAGAHPCTRVLVVAHLAPSGGTGRKHGDWTQSTLVCSDDPRTGRLGHHQDIDQRRRAFSRERMSDAELAAWKEHEIFLARAFVSGRLAVSR